MAWAEQHGDSWRVRYRRDDGTIGTITGFPNKTAAADYADDLESEQRGGTWIDPAAGRTTMTEFIEPDWFDALDVDSRTEQNYRNRWNNHIKPRWGNTALNVITNRGAQAWAKKLRASGKAPVTVDDIMKLFTMMLADAVEEKLIPANPIRPRRRGRRRHPGAFTQTHLGSGAVAFHCARRCRVLARDFLRLGTAIIGFLLGGRSGGGISRPARRCP